MAQLPDRYYLGGHLKPWWRQIRAKEEREKEEDEASTESQGA